MVLLTKGTHSSHQVEIVLPAGAKSKPFPNFPQRGAPLIPGLLYFVIVFGVLELPLPRNTKKRTKKSTGKKRCGVGWCLES
jgi:hypothetical protein